MRRLTEPPAASEEDAEPIPPEKAAWEDEGGPIGLGPGIRLVLRGPDGEDMDAALAAARAALPEGFRLERE